ncbi:MAG: hypothetical protein KC503_36275, partial [Myxococcales bacterium]|nr:hypothetical protein [Myxococcales bacterium]
MNARAQMIALLSLGAHLVLCEAALAAPTITHSPSTVVLDGKRRTIEIVIRGLEGSLRVQTAVNVGDVDVIHAHHDKIEVYYRVPARRAPQRLCLLVWRGAGPVLLVRVPLLGQTKVPITTRPRARVTLSIAGRRFGPASSDDAGKLTMAVVVPPGVTRGHVEVVDDVGLTTRKPLDIARARYNPICMAVRRVAGPSARQPRFEIVAASAELDAPPPTLRAV